MAATKQTTSKHQATADTRTIKAVKPNPHKEGSTRKSGHIEVAGQQAAPAAPPAPAHEAAPVTPPAKKSVKPAKASTKKQATKPAVAAKKAAH